MRNLKLIFEYDGTMFSGFAVQPGKRTVESELKKAVKAVTGKSPAIKTAGRTDSGVHALNQVVNFLSRTRIPAEKLLPALNRHLPDDIVIKRAEDAPPDFDSRRSAKARTYNYLIISGSHVPLRLKRYAWHVKPPLDIKKMMSAAKKFEGLHDFMSFCAKEDYNKTFLRRVFHVKVRSGKVFGDAGVRPIEVEVKASGFLHNMVRVMVGTLVDIGKGRMRPEMIVEILRKKDRRAAGVTAPAKGLTLMKVDY